MALSDLLSSFGDLAPSGEDLEYDTEFQALEMAAKPGEERQAGAEIIAAEDPDFRDVAKRATGILKRSHDLRAAMYFTFAAGMTRGFEGVAEGTSYLRGVLETYWDSCYPELDLDDPDDMALFRVNTLRGLTDGTNVMRALREAPLTLSTAFGRVTLRDLAVADGEMEAPAGAQLITDAATISAAFQDTDPKALAAIAAAARQALEDVRAIDKVFDEKVPGQGPDLAPLVKLLRKAVERLNDVTGTGDEQVAETADEVSDAASEPVASTGRASTGAPEVLSSPAEVQKALDRILDYYRKHEPSSPLPILLERAKRLVGADFVTILKDMAPDGVENVFLIGGITDEDE